MAPRRSGPDVGAEVTPLSSVVNAPAILLISGASPTHAVPVAEQLACKTVRDAEVTLHPVVRAQHVFVGEDENPVRPVAWTGSVLGRTDNRVHLCAE